jgi:hypothetical protein
MIQENMQQKNNNKSNASNKGAPKLEAVNFINLDESGILPNEQLNIDLIPLNILKRE